MLDPITTPLLLYVLGRIGEELIADACKDYLKDRLKDLFGWLAGFGRKDDLTRAYEIALQDAMTACLELLLKNLEAHGYSKDELKTLESQLKALIRDPALADELLEAIRNPADATRPSPEAIAARWQALGGQPLDPDVWSVMAKAFRRHALKTAFVNEHMREVLNAQNLDRVRELLERAGGIRPDVHPAKYALRMRTKYAPIDLANLMPAHAGDPGQLIIRDVFVPQRVKENPPAVELPKDLQRRLQEDDDGKHPARARDQQATDEKALHERLARDYIAQTPRWVLEVLAEPQNRLLMLTGEPGSGKSTLLRYLLLGVLDPPCDAGTGEPLPWTASFSARTTFPLLIELRDFHATRARHDDIDNFLDYILFLGRTQHYFVDDAWLDGTLKSSPSLVMFDGLDEIFDRNDRDKVMQEIVGFALNYPQARIVVTSRPVGYRDTTFRQAGFAHFALQDLDLGQVDVFVRGWFALTFPQQPDLAQQRVERILSSVNRSPSIRLLAGNPMLLTIMALLAREQELPRERAAFYEAAVNVLCHHWDANRNLSLPDTDYLHIDDKKEFLRRIAYRMQTGNSGLAGNAIHEETLETEIADWLKTRFRKREDDAILLARKLIAQLRERNYILCLRGPRLYGFVHRTFLEYLTATEYVARFRDAQEMSEADLLSLYDRHAEDDDWREVLRLIAGQVRVQMVEKIIEHLIARVETRLSGQGDISALVLAIQCLGETRAAGQLETAGRNLFRTAFQTFASGLGPRQFEFYGGVVAAAQEIGPLWPGLDQVQLQAYDFDQIGAKTLDSIYFPRFLLAVRPDRDLQLLIADSQHFGLRLSAYQSLADVWPDPETRTLLHRRAIDDASSDLRGVLLGILASTWPDTATDQLLRQRVIDDADGQVRGSAASCLGRAHSHFGAILFTRDLDGVLPYLDPRDPVTEEHLEEAANRADVDPAALPATIAELNAHLGWEITQGLGAKPS